MEKIFYSHNNFTNTWVWNNTCFPMVVTSFVSIGVSSFWLVWELVLQLVFSWICCFTRNTLYCTSDSILFYSTLFFPILCWSLLSIYFYSYLFLLTEIMKGCRKLDVRTGCARTSYSTYQEAPSSKILPILSLSVPLLSFLSLPPYLLPTYLPSSLSPSPFFPVPLNDVHWLCSSLN